MHDARGVHRMRSGGVWRAIERLVEEAKDLGPDLLHVCLEREVPRVEEMHFGVWIVTLESIRARRQEERIVLAPYGQQRRPLLAEVRLKLRIEPHIAGVIEKQIELDLVDAGS